MPEVVVDVSDYQRRKREEKLVQARFDPIRFGELVDKDPPKRAWIVEEWLPRATVTALYGQGGVGKSLLAQQLATAIAGGRRWLGADAAQGLVMGLFCEDDKNELWRRQLALCKHYEVSLEFVSAFLELDARMGRENVLAAERQRLIDFTDLMDHLHEVTVQRMPLLLIIDNIAQVFSGNENDRSLATQFINRLSRIALDAFCAVLLLGHPSKMAGSEYSGSTGWDAAVRSRWFLERQTEKVNGKDQPTGGLMLRRLKANYASQDNVLLEWESGAYVRVDGNDVVTSVRRRNREAEAEALILAGIPVLLGMGQRCTPHRTSSDYYLPKQMERHGLAGNVSRRALEGALARLMADGRLVIDKRRNETSRKLDEWLVLGPEATPKK